MSVRTIACPTCQAVLKVTRSSYEDKPYQCPRCSNSFVVPVPTGRLASPRSVAIEETRTPPERRPTDDVEHRMETSARQSTKLLGVALIAAVLLVGAGIIGAIVLTRPRPTPSPVAVNTDEKLSAADEKKQLEEERRLLQEQKKRLEEDRRHAGIERLLKQGATALADQKFEEAAQAYHEALKLAPTDVEAAKGLSAARAGLTNATKEKQTEEERRAEFARLLEQGKSALAKKQYAAAVLAFEAAGRLLPGDVAASAALRDAQQALAADQEEKKKLADYQKYMDAGQSALLSGRYADALREFGAAERLLPGDGAALQGQRAAEKKLGEANDLDKRRTAYAQLIEQGKTALAGQRYEEALQAYTEANRLFPNDRDAQRGLQQAQQGSAEVRKAFNQLKAQGDLALRNQRLEEAVRAYTEAARLFPNDKGVQEALRHTQKIMNDAQAAQAAYVRFMTMGDIAMTNQRYGDAVQAYLEALRLAPNDVLAQRGWRDAKAAYEEEVRKRGNYDRQMQAGVLALKQQQFADAVRAFGEALKLYPNDFRAAAALQQAKYAQHMAEGQAAMNAKRYADAVKAFEDALREVPGDPAALTALKQARALNKK